LGYVSRSLVDDALVNHSRNRLMQYISRTVSWGAMFVYSPSCLCSSKRSCTSAKQVRLTSDVSANPSPAVATIIGIIFGPVALNLFNPFKWGNTDQITLELSRIVLIVQVFAVGVELPKAYMWRHWKSLFILLVPVMAYGWVVSSAFIYWLIPAFNFVCLSEAPR